MGLFKAFSPASILSILDQSFLISHPKFLWAPFLGLSRNGRFSSRPPPQNPGIVARPVISLGDLLQLWHPTSHLHWRYHVMIRQSLHSPPHWSPQFLDPDIFRTESPSSTVRHKSPSQQILKCKHVLESQGDVLEKSQGRHITKIQFGGWILPLQFAVPKSQRRGKKAASRVILTRALFSGEFGSSQITSSFWAAQRPRGRCRAACRITCGGVGPGCIQKHLDQSIKVSKGATAHAGPTKRGPYCS